MKSCLVLCDFRDIAFKVDNFNSETMQKIEDSWDSIKEAIRMAITLVSSYGYNQDTLTSNNAVIPIAYYLLKKGLPKSYVQSKNYEQDRQLVHKWLLFGLLKRVFSGQPDNVLRPLRRVISGRYNEFPLLDIIEEFKGGMKSFSFNDDEINNLLSYKYGQKHTFSVLALLYPTLDFRNQFHLDHIFAKSYFTKRKLTDIGIPQSKHDFYLEHCNSIINLQLLEGTPNIEKSDQKYSDWLDSTFLDPIRKSEYMGKNYIPDIDLDFTNFDTFIAQRKSLLFDKLKAILTVNLEKVVVQE